MMRITKLGTLLAQITDVEEITKVFTLSDGTTVIYSGVTVLNSLSRYSEFYTNVEFALFFGHFVNTHWGDYLKAYKAMTSDYNPIHNYDNTERFVDTTDNGTITSVNTPNNTITNNTPSKSQTDNYTTTNDDAKTGRLENYSVNTIGDGDRVTTTTTTSGTDTTVTTHDQVSVDYSISGQNVFTADTVTTHTLTRQGNIGVTTTQNMIDQEIELRKKCILDLFIDAFAKDYFFIGGDISDIDIIYE